MGELATGGTEVLVVGGAVAGLAAAEALADEANVTLYERQSYETKRVNCGEAINDATLVPLEKTGANGFINDVDGFQVLVYPNTDREPRSQPLTTSTLRCEPGYICDRDTIERQWARRLERRGVDVRDGEPLGVAEYRDAVDEYDYVIDATGQPSLTLRAYDLVHEYTGDLVALNAEVEGDFGEYATDPRIFFEGFVGYSWSFPKSESRANVGIGWAGENRPDNYFEALRDTCRRNRIPIPHPDIVNVYTIPCGPSLRPDRTSFPDESVFLVGDAAGIANRYQGEGICQAIRSAYLLADLIQTGREQDYPDELYESMKREYRLAHLIRGMWLEHEDPELLADLLQALDGLTITQITREPRSVVARILRHPTLAVKLFTDRGMLRRCIDAYTDTWEYSVSSRSTA